MPKNLSDQELRNAIESKKHSSFVYLYDRYAAAFYGDIKRTLLKEDVSAETLKNVILDIWTNIESFNPGKERFFTWSLKIARKEIRRQKTEIVLFELFKCQQMPPAQLINEKK